MKKGMIFIDGSNVFYDWKKATAGKQLDIQKYIEQVKRKYMNIDFVRTYYFTTQTSTNVNFLQQINKIPYTQAVTGRLQNKTIKIDTRAGIKCSHCGGDVVDTFVTQVDKGTDVNIAVEMLKHAYNKAYDIAVLISRDADFAGVVKIIKDLGQNVELVLFEDSKGDAQELTETVDNITLITRSEYSSLERI
ncbi:MAG: NYN domain-containing protein [Lachnospiraceae bacterium]|nr:NYN domain-containing protein [Butyrivibrio sp.]MCM1344602.1 NYN domain-containing protein [Muribaculaceae bacterium]MCM1410639.1 NYN domain-containing protein [Lachnospiraceae bacterium]